MASISVREATQADATAVGKLIFETIHAINSKDYSPEQLQAWCDSPTKFASWDDIFCGNY